MTKAQIVTLLQSKGHEDTNEKLVHTSEGTFAVVKKKSFGPPNNPANDNRSNRAQTLWKMSKHVIVEDVVTDNLVWEGAPALLSEKDQVLQSWRLVTSKDPDRPHKTQSLYFTQDGSVYLHYDSDGNLICTGTLEEIVNDLGMNSETVMESRFRLWLPLHGVSDDTVNGYVSHLKAVSEDPAPHTSTGVWKGFYYDLVGHPPAQKVFCIDSLQLFDRVFADLITFFDQETPNPSGFNAANYQACYDYSHDTRSGDQRKTLNGFRKYREFLGELCRFDILAAIRTKPFILLAGISGTGKSRMVRQLARGCCPARSPLKDEQKPGNFEMIQVRPNWHDSTELMGYVTRITEDKKPKYVLTDFVSFLARAWTYREIPFFLCLDEMNLAPVEQYFAEYLSVIESRAKMTLDAGHAPFEAIATDNLVRWESLEADTRQAAIDELFNGKDWANAAEHGRVEQVKRMFAADKGIRIPPNLVVMGTVNMDETTCTFSRKVLDRAMSFELNDVSDMYDASKIAGEGDVPFDSISAGAAWGELLSGKDVCDVDLEMCKKILAILQLLNDGEVTVSSDGGSEKKRLLAGTPFKIAYRSRNEILIYCHERTKGGMVSLPKALDEALSMKVLSRIEGDSQKVPKAWLELLKKTIEERLAALPGYVADDCKVCADKLRDMAEQAELGYTSFWMR